MLLWFLLMKFCSRDVKRGRKMESLVNIWREQASELERGVIGFGTIND